MHLGASKRAWPILPRQAGASERAWPNLPRQAGASERPSQILVPVVHTGTSHLIVMSNLQEMIKLNTRIINLL